jgi:hypothetical protein
VRLAKKRDDVSIREGAAGTAGEATVGCRECDCRRIENP